MAHSAPSLEIDLSWQMRENEARLLAELLRTSRLTLLYGETAAARTTLLQGGVLPLLRRRASDTIGAEARESRVVIPFPDRRQRRAGRSSTRIAERVVFFDHWDDAPATGVRSATLATVPPGSAAGVADGTLSEVLAALSHGLDCQFLIILDRFEDFLDGKIEQAESERFVVELSDVVNRSDLRANFVLSLSDDAKFRLDGLRQRIPGLDDSTLRLLRWQSAARPIPVLSDVALLPAGAPLLVLAPIVLPSVSAAPVEQWGAAPLRIAPASASLTSGSVDLSLDPPAKAESPIDVSHALRASARSAQRRELQPSRVPSNVAPPIRKEGVYEFIESTLAQTASAYAVQPWGNSGPSSDTTGPGPGLGDSSRPTDDYRFDPAAFAQTVARMTNGHGQDLVDLGDANGHEQVAEAVGSTRRSPVESALGWLRRAMRPLR